MVYRIKCQICGNDFDANGRNAKYCPGCKPEYYRQAMQKQRNKTRDCLAAASSKTQAEINAEIQSRNEALEKNYWKRIDRQAKKGDKYALMKLALKNKDFLQYWLLYRDCVLENEVNYNHKIYCLIGGIDIHDKNFNKKIANVLK